MSIITVVSSGSPAANISITQGNSNTATILSSTGPSSSVITINQGLAGPQGPEGIPGTGYVEILAGSGIEVISSGTTYTISSSPSGTYSLIGHTHTSSQITDFNNSVSGLLPVKNISAGSYVNVSSSTGVYTISVTGLQPTGNYSAVGHTHTASNITDFNSSVSGLLPVKNLLAGSNISISSSSGVYTINSTGGGSPILSEATLSNNGRLTLVSGNPIGSGNTVSSTLYYSPYLGNMISLYNVSTSSWDTYTFNEILLSLSGMIIDTNYDIFLFDNAGTLTLENIAWTNNSTRSINLIYQNGILVRSDNLSKRYLGSIRSTSSTTTEDSETRRLVFNINNPIEKILIASDNTTHTYTSGTIRPYRGLTNIGVTRVELLCGMITSPIKVVCDSTFTTETGASSVGVGQNTTTANNTSAINITTVSSGPALIFSNNSIDILYSSLGYNYLQLLQSGGNITTFYTASFKAALLC